MILFKYYISELRVDYLQISKLILTMTFKKTFETMSFFFSLHSLGLQLFSFLSNTHIISLLDF